MLFLTAMFFIPVCAAVPVIATAPVLILIGALMMHEIGVSLAAMPSRYPILLPVHKLPCLVWVRGCSGSSICLSPGGMPFTKGICRSGYICRCGSKR